MPIESEQNVKFPKRLRHRGKGKVLATIYKRPDCYRLYWRARVDGKPKSRMKDCKSYAEAKREGDKVVIRVVNESSTFKMGEYWDNLLSATQARFIRAIEALARVRRLARNTPALQINISREGGQ